MKKTNLNIIATILVMAVVLISCKDETVNAIGEIKKDYKLNLISDLGMYESLSHADSSLGNSYGDTFDIDSFYVKDNWLYIIVGYSGGCEAHTFDIVWDGNTDASVTNYVDRSLTIFNIAIKHDANDDVCEAYISDTLKVDLNVLLEEYGDTLPDDFIINIANGYSGEDGSSGTGDYLFAQSETCILEVTAEKVPCGIGVWDNLWFRVKKGDDVNSDSLDFLLQPIVLDGEWLIAPEEGKTYKVGVFQYYADITDSIGVCLAYPGLNIPVKVFCYEEVE